MKKYLLTPLALLLLFTACGRPNSKVTITHPPMEESLEVAWKCSTPEAQWQDKDSFPLTPGTDEYADICIDTYALGQEVTGFGGCFNEKGWAALSVLSPEERDTVMREMFDSAKGARFNLCRVPIGASDYALSRYTLNETEGDVGMEHFSIERDRECLIPYIEAAMEYRPDLRVWGSAWTPPTWMKTNGDFDGGHMKDDPEVYRSYALYLARFVEAYRAEGIDLFAVAVQNEPLIETHYPSCLWEPEQFATVIKDHIGPLFRQRAVPAEIMLGTIQDADFRLYPLLLKDRGVNRYVSIVGFQWDGIRSVALMRKYFPDKAIYQTETECGNCHWKEGFDPDRPQNDWAYGVYTWNKVKEYFDAGVNAYLLWNMVLDEEGKSIDADLPWPQNAPITVDQDTGYVTYTPMFYAFKHFSYYVEPGSRYVDIDSGDNAVAFLNPGGSLIIELQNPEEAPRAVTLLIDGGIMTAELPAMSWNTLIVPGH